MPMTPETVMQIASVSKPVAAYTVVRLARAGRVELDAPIERLTAGWRLPESEFDAQEVTLRRLLSHTAGINVGGYQGLRPGSALPSTEASLAGASGAGKVRIVDAPGRAWRYSGGVHARAAGGGTGDRRAVFASRRTPGLASLGNGAHGL
jgi:CubicO group peptidase (beta-lactamase class C family)